MEKKIIERKKELTKRGDERKGRKERWMCPERILKEVLKS